MQNIYLTIFLLTFSFTSYSKQPEVDCKDIVRWAIATKDDKDSSFPQGDLSKPQVQRINNIIGEIKALAANDPERAVEYCIRHKDYSFFGRATGLAKAGATAGAMDEVTDHELDGMFAKRKRVDYTMGFQDSKPICINPNKIPACDVEMYNYLGLDPAIGELDNSLKVYGPSNLPMSYDSDQCACIEADLKAKNASTIGILSNQNEKDNVANMIFEASGQKFINDFASLYEDVHFYASNKAWVLEKSKDEISGLICNDPKEFEAAVKTACDKTGMSEGSAERMTKYLSSFGAMGTKGDVASSFNSIIQDIDVFTPDSKNVTDKENIFTREKYDKTRFALSKNQSDVGWISDAVTTILRDKDLKGILESKIKEGMLPKDALFDMIANSSESQAKEILKETKKDRNKKKISKLLALVGTPQFKIDVDKSFTYAMNLSPGLKNLLMNPKLFGQISAKVTKRNEEQGILNIMDVESESLNAHFKDRCNQLQNNMAEAVCTPPEKLQEKINREDMMHVLAKKGAFKKDNRDFLELTLCSMNRNPLPKKNSAFDGLDLEKIEPFKSADYTDRKLHPNDQTNGMANMYNKTKSDKTFSTKLENITNAHDYARVSLPGFSNGSDPVAKSHMFEKLANPFTEKEVTSNFKEKLSNTPTEIKRNTDFVEGAANIASNMQNVSNVNSQVNRQPASKYMAPETYSNKENNQEEAPISPSHAKIQNILNPVGQTNQSAKVVNNLSKADADELLRLREERLNNAREISELKMAQEKQKADDLKNKYEQLEKRYADMSKGKNPANFQGGSTTGNSDYSVSGNLGQFKEKSFENYNGGGSTTGGAPQSSSSVSGSANMNSGSVNGSLAAANKDLVEASPKNEMKILVKRSVDGQVKDPSAALIEYLEKNEPDNLMLENIITTKSVVITYEDIAQDGRTTIHVKKIIRYDDLTPQAKTLLDKKLQNVVQETKRQFLFQSLKYELLNADRLSSR